MREASFLIRWGIPGTMFFIMFFLFVLLDNLWCNLYYSNIYFRESNETVISDPERGMNIALLNDTLNVKVQSENSSVNTHSLIHRMRMEKFFKDYSLVGLVAFFVSSSIPVGFIISQLYYFGFWLAFPFKSRRNIRKVLTSEQINDLLKKYDISDLLKREKKFDSDIIREKYLFDILNTIQKIKNLIFKKKPSHDTLDKIFLNHYEWLALDWHCKLKATKDEKAQLESTGNVMHSLGTTFISVTLSFLIFMLLHSCLPNYDAFHNIIKPDDNLHITAISCLLMLSLFLVLWQNRKVIIRNQIFIFKALYYRTENRIQFNRNIDDDDDEDKQSLFSPGSMLH